MALTICARLRQHAAEVALAGSMDSAHSLLHIAATIERLEFAAQQVLRAGETRSLQKRHLEQLESALLIRRAPSAATDPHLAPLGPESPVLPPTQRRNTSSVAH